MIGIFLHVIGFPVMRFNVAVDSTVLDCRLRTRWMPLAALFYASQVGHKSPRRYFYFIERLTSPQKQVETTCMWIINDTKRVVRMLIFLGKAQRSLTAGYGTTPLARCKTVLAVKAIG